MRPKNKKITIYEVAQKAGVAISTVSRVLNNSPNVSQKTKDKVNEAITELNFRPQVSARKLASREPQMLDRKSTRLNSSHVAISYAVFCLKKKNIQSHT